MPIIAQLMTMKEQTRCLQLETYLWLYFGILGFNASVYLATLFLLFYGQAALSLIAHHLVLLQETRQNVGGWFVDHRI